MIIRRLMLICSITWAWRLSRRELASLLVEPIVSREYVSAFVVILFNARADSVSLLAVRKAGDLLFVGVVDIDWCGFEKSWIVVHGRRSIVV